MDEDIEEDVMDMGEMESSGVSAAASLPLQSSPDTFPLTPDTFPLTPHGHGVAGPVQPQSSRTQTCEEMANMRYTSPISQQISLAEYNSQAHCLTQQALQDLKALPEYKKHTMRCHSCGCSWYDGQFSEGCKECSGFAMHKPCPICHGHCGKMWQRNVEMSHSAGEAHWDGRCGHQDAARLIKDMLYMENITDGMQALGTEETK